LSRIWIVGIVAGALNGSLLGAQPAVNYAGITGRSDIVLARPNTEPGQAMPLGNGRLGVAAWSAEGLTLQLNRVDTLPDRAPLALVTIPGLARLTAATDYAGRLDLYNGEFQEHGGGMNATVYVDSASDNLVIDVAGAPRDEMETVKLSLAPPRTPKAEAVGETAILSETWMDNLQPGASGRTFGSLAAVRAEAKDVSVRVTNSNTVTLSFKPRDDGGFRIFVAGPHFNADAGPAASVANANLNSAAHEAVNVHRDGWHHFWKHAGYMKITSMDGAGEYMENLRALYLYSAAASSAGEYPGSQAGVADMFCAVPVHNWDPGAFWHWNLRMQVAANLSAGVPELNAPYFNLYRENLGNIEKWTQAHMNGRPGICVPETMRFNGPGIEYETWNKDAPTAALDCDSGFKPYYNARTISTGAEVGLWIWQQYLATDDREFLAKNFPVMAAAARFLLAYEAPGKDGLLHTEPSNAHETQWDTTDPTTDLAAREALYKATIKAAHLLGAETALASQLGRVVDKIPPLPRTEAGTAKTLLAASADAGGEDVIAASYVPAAENKNVENIGLEPVWPYDLIGDTSPLFELARRTYQHRPYPTNQDWSFDPIQAARLELPDVVQSTLIKLTETYQTFINGYANWGGKTGEFYIEQQGVVAAALQEALVQDYDGVIRVNPAFPHEWDVDGQVAVRGKTKVDVQMRGGEVRAVAIEAGTAGQLKVRNPWGEAAVEVASPGHAKITLQGATLELSVLAGRSYRLQRVGERTGNPVAEEITGTPPKAPRKLGKVQIGLFAESR
jgi:alpha-L-fucosidase 2